MAKDDETIRWPTNLDRKAIEQRLLEVSKLAAAHDLADISDRFSSVEKMTSAEIASKVVNSLTWLFNLPEHDRVKHYPVSKELEMVALNLKNLK